MMNLLLAKVKMLIRKPGTFLVMTIATIGFALVFTLGTGSINGLYVPIVAENDGIKQSIMGEVLTDSEAHSFRWVSEEELRWQINNGKVELGVILRENDFDIIVGFDSQNINLIEQTIQNAYMKKSQFEQLKVEASNLFAEEELKQKIIEIKEGSAFTITNKNFTSQISEIDFTYQPLFGFVMFFLIYTIAFNVLNILIEKHSGVWDRIILSPVKKWQMYVANFIYSFLTGYAQVILIFLVFRYIVNVDFNGNFLLSLVIVIPYIVAIVALCILVLAIVNTVQQFNALMTIIAVSMAMLGGSFWPLEIVESEFILNLSKIIPITYGMELLSGVAVFGYSVSDLLLPISVLLLMGVTFTGIGIHLMEKRHV